MKRLRILKMILVRTKAIQILSSFLIFVFGRAASVLLSIYAVLVIAIVTDVVVNYYTQIIQIQQEETVAALVHKLEHLPELSKEELTKISERAKELHQKTDR